MIEDYTNGSVIDSEIFYCADKIIGTAKNGTLFCSVTLQDKTGQLAGKIWDYTSSIEDFGKGDFIKISGNVGVFRDTNQVTITRISVVDKDSVDISDYCPITPKDIDELTNKLKSLVDSVKTPCYKQLLNCFFGNEAFLERFASASAAKSVHHAYVGGLLEHSVGVATLCDFYVTQYPTLNRDLLVTAALCHDIGKIKEISAFPDNDYTDIGQLLGHIYIGAEMIDVQARKIEDFPKVKLAELKHCILAHHGQLEYGSPKKPMLFEAMMLHLADELDAKARRFEDNLATLEGLTWSERPDFMMYNERYRNTSE